ncbi:substrate-binding domain-containing protein [Paenibacillus sp. NEAU-GSW1]|uniref:substrate-binding domain-containing protein n=1 Tax=Paenibacillus sp. NEAU-GSW1 TaxID=2682486 RepID=UPI0012E118EA|nr:substrate-binding domain-containing protein [Paenibacillus sp. NEAU-GSW1]MUT67216.1 substrate-binding domain-containing protein [Paenibacillus sp. NEAU-GSW1]
MANRRWNIGILLLLAIFLAVLLQFFVASQNIRKLVLPSETGSGKEETKRQIVLISQEIDNPFWRSVEQGAREAASQFGMELQYTGPYRINPEEQVKLLQKAIAARADAIIVQGIGDAGQQQAIAEADLLGIPIIAVDTDEPSSSRLSFIGTDNIAAGQETGKLIIRHSDGEPGVIGVLLGSDLAASQQLRLEGLRSVIKEHPQLTVAEVRASDISRLQAEQQAEEMLRMHPEMNYMVGFSSLDGIGIAQAVKRLKPGAVTIYAFDDLEETLTGIQQGSIHATMVQQPFRMGYEAIAQLDRHFKGRKVHEQILTPIQLIDQKKTTSSSVSGQSSGGSR